MVNHWATPSTVKAQGANPCLDTFHSVGKFCSIDKIQYNALVFQVEISYVFNIIMYYPWSNGVSMCEVFSSGELLGCRSDNANK